MKIAFEPPLLGNNEYVNLVLEKAREEFDIYSVYDLFRSWKLFWKTKIVHLNWFENVDSYTRFLKKIIIVYILIICRKRILVTFHNNEPHSSKYGVLQRILLSLLIKSANKIVIHSHLSENILAKRYHINSGRIIYIPHPNYIDKYGPYQKTEERSNRKLRLLFIGAIMAYKNIEYIIDIAKIHSDDIELHIAGRAFSLEYEQVIKESVQNCDNIKVEAEFISNEKIPKLISNCDLLVLPYDLSSSLNSGTIFLAFSYKRSVIAPLIGTIQDIEDKRYILSYSYSSSKEHFEKLNEQILKAIELKKDDEFVFSKWGERMFEYVTGNHRNDYIQSSFISLYDSLSGQSE